MECCKYRKLKKKTRTLEEYLKDSEEAALKLVDQDLLSTGETKTGLQERSNEQ